MKNQRFRKPYKIKRRKSILRNSFFWIGILIVSLVILLVYFLFFHSFFEIKNIEISGNNKVKTEQISNLIEKKNIFLFNKKEARGKILNNFPEIVEVIIKRNLPATIKIEIEERKPVALICQNDCFFIDKKGIIFEKTENNEILKIKNLTLNQELKLGEKALEKEQLDKFLKIESNLKQDLGIKTDLIELVSEKRLNVYISEGWQVYFDLQGDIDWQLVELKTILEKEISLEEREKLEYIDLRFDKTYVSPEGLL